MTLKKQYADIELLRLIYRGWVFQVDSQYLPMNGQPERIDTIGIIRDDKKVALYIKRENAGKRPIYEATGAVVSLDEARKRAASYMARNMQSAAQKRIGAQYSVCDQVLMKLRQA